MEESYEFMKILSIEEAKKIAFKKRVIIITGVTGQDGSLMADYLLKFAPDFELFGGARRLSVSNHENICHLKDSTKFHLINFDLTDAHSISQIISQLKPAYFINFAAQSFVKSSWDFPIQTLETDTTSIVHILEAIRLHSPECRFYNAGSSEEFGAVSYSPQDEKHPLNPQSPYGASKASARHFVRVYRESYNLYAIQGWLFNHEGTRRGEEFVTRKITTNVARIIKEMEDPREVVVPMELGNLSAMRDWSDAEDCVDAVWLMLNQDVFNKKFTTYKPFPPKLLKEYVVGSGHTHTIRDFVEESFRHAGVLGVWVGQGVDERFQTYQTDKDHPMVLVKVNPDHYRPAEVQMLCSNPSLIKAELGWTPKTSFKQLVTKMTNHDMKSYPNREE